MTNRLYECYRNLCKKHVLLFWFTNTFCIKVHSAHARNHNLFAVAPIISVVKICYLYYAIIFLVMHNNDNTVLSSVIANYNSVKILLWCKIRPHNHAAGRHFRVEFLSGIHRSPILLTKVPWCETLLFSLLLPPTVELRFICDAMALVWNAELKHKSCTYITLYCPVCVLRHIYFCMCYALLKFSLPNATIC